MMIMINIVTMGAKLLIRALQRAKPHLVVTNGFCLSAAAPAAADLHNIYNLHGWNIHFSKQSWYDILQNLTYIFRTGLNFLEYNEKSKTNCFI